ncbi:PTS sugar transporter subunit IIA [Neobacillus mesonae]|uniref:PTS sugar transporter subunit IIA n=1 Tax=Neobacillus mesonae TaxID=1193713 RepID=UPI0020417B78|nr:PTS sugar transporter subunit IIA [Neobacillus mesonae]MCM3568988.1 PTS sugar transporter subunit IIA [Neobacillus mesonae]
MESFVVCDSNILLNLDVRTKDDLLEMMARNLIKNGYVKESFLKAIIAREKIFPTGLPTAGVHVAIPHTDIEHVHKKTISVGVLKKPVDFSMMGGGGETVQVKLVFMLAMDEAHSQLELLQKLMAILQDRELLEFIVSEKDKTSIANVLNKKLNQLDSSSIL